MDESSNIETTYWAVWVTSQDDPRPVSIQRYKEANAPLLRTYDELGVPYIHGPLKLSLNTIHRTFHG